MSAATYDAHHRYEEEPQLSGSDEYAYSYDYDDDRQSSGRHHSDDWASERSISEAEEEDEDEYNWPDDAPVLSEASSAAYSDHGGDDGAESNDLVPSNEESIERSSVPSGAWTESEVERGYLLSECAEAPRVAHARPSSAYRSTLKEFVDEHLAYRRYQVDKGAAAVDGRSFAAKLYGWAEYYEYTSGKFVVFAPSSGIDSLWVALREANEGGLLGGRVECYPQEGDSHRLCVRVNDYTKLDDATATLHALRSCTVVHGARIVCFKPDFLTLLGVYQRRERTGALYTYGELGIADCWMHPQLHEALSKLNKRRSGAHGKRRRRGRRRSGGDNVQAAPRPLEWQANAYETNVKYEPSRPNGVWDDEEVATGWLAHHSEWTPRAAPREIRDKEKLDARAQRMLSRWGSGAGSTTAERRAFMARLYKLAAAHDYVIGKWKVFVPPRVADALWAEMCGANARGELGGCLKMCAYNGRSRRFLLCVYVNDFTDVDECRRVLRVAARIAARYDVQVVANFKADFLTSLGVYRARAEEREVHFALSEMSLARVWPYEPLQRVLDEEKAAWRERGVNG